MVGRGGVGRGLGRNAGTQVRVRGIAAGRKAVKYHMHMVGVRGLCSTARIAVIGPGLGLGSSWDRGC